jgi:hypothetical protein
MQPHACDSKAATKYAVEIHYRLARTISVAAPVGESLAAPKRRAFDAANAH